MKDKNYARGLRVTLEVPKGWEQDKFLQIVLTPCKLPNGAGPVFDIPGSKTVLVSGIAQFALCKYPGEISSLINCQSLGNDSFRLLRKSSPTRSRC